MFEISKNLVTIFDGDAIGDCLELPEKCISFSAALVFGFPFFFTIFARILYREQT